MFRPRAILTGFLSATVLALAISTPSADAASCGNGMINNTEACDDGNLAGSDGCSPTCMVESGFDCVGTNPSVCTPVACGNGIVQSGEACDGGACCLENCTFASSATTCRGSAGVCDSAENCSGSASTCPVDARSNAVCRPAVSPECDVVESCDGAAVECPIDVLVGCADDDGADCTQPSCDVSFDDCDALCAGDPVVDGPTARECEEQLSCFNEGGRMVAGQCARGNCASDTGLYCGADYGPCPAIGEVPQECVRFDDNCASHSLCSDDLDAPAQVCIKGGRASSPRICKEARMNDCTIDSCEQ